MVRSLAAHATDCKRGEGKRVRAGIFFAHAPRTLCHFYRMAVERHHHGLPCDTNPNN
jgi:hypothetical protein